MKRLINTNSNYIFDNKLQNDKGANYFGFDTKIFKQYVCLGTFSLLVVMILFVMLSFQNRTVNVMKLTNVEMRDISECYYRIGELQEGKNGDLVKGEFIDSEMVYDYYDYGIDCYGKAVYSNVRFVLIGDEELYVMPTKLSFRENIDVDNMDISKDGYYGFTACIPQKYSEIYNYVKKGYLVRNLEGEYKLYVVQ